MIVLPLIDNSKLGFWKRRALYSLSRKKRNGIVKFTEKSICVFHNKNAIHYYLNEVNELIINGNLFLELSVMNFPDLSPDQKIIYSGRTKFTLTLKNQKIAINFLITNKSQFEQLNGLIKVWYLSKQFKIKEYDSQNGRMLLMNPYYSYESIQKVKKEIGVDSMYD